MQEFMTMAANYGFPMGVAAFLLVRIEGKMDALNDSIQMLVQTIARK